MGPAKHGAFGDGLYGAPGKEPVPYPDDPLLSDNVLFVVACCCWKGGEEGGGEGCVCTWREGKEAKHTGLYDVKIVTSLMGEENTQPYRTRFRFLLPLLIDSMTLASPASKS